MNKVRLTNRSLYIYSICGGEMLVQNWRHFDGMLYFALKDNSPLVLYKNGAQALVSFLKEWLEHSNTNDEPDMKIKTQVTEDMLCTIDATKDELLITFAEDVMVVTVKGFLAAPSIDEPTAGLIIAFIEQHIDSLIDREEGV